MRVKRVIGREASADDTKEDNMTTANILVSHKKTVQALTIGSTIVSVRGGANV